MSLFQAFNYGFCYLTSKSLVIYSVWKKYVRRRVQKLTLISRASVENKKMEMKNGNLEM